MRFYVCNPLLLYIWINIIYHAFSYDLLVNTEKTKVKSSSMYKTKSYSGSADKTIDRDFDQIYTNCMHTETGQKDAWLMIDLGDIFNLKSVKIWYRNDRGNNSTRRLKGFSVLTSINSESNINDTCYQDPGNVTLEAVLEVNCSHTAQFVKIYTNKSNEEGGPILEICEVQIWGCSRKKFGEKCISCDPCKQDCDITGRCNRFGCLHDGFILPYCKDCQKGFYGRNCTPCGHCLKNATCDQESGSCPGGYCDPGWKHKEYRCDQECDNGTFGYYCGNNCSGNCAGRLSCKKTDGICPSGCADGWMNRHCNETCSPGHYGKNCTKKCGHCESNKLCHHVNGSCPVCEPGYYGEKCNKTCSPGHYGKNCTVKCGNCESKKPCHHINGSCPGVCEPGYHGEKCINTCSPGHYGKNCKKKCGNCESNKLCHHINGSCAGFCEPGYSGEKCNKNQLVKPGHTRAWSSSVAWVYGGYPNKTVDGDFRQSSYTYCMHTAGREPEAWLRINLRKIYNINSVKFWYRNDSQIPGYNTRRIQGFNIRLSNTTQTNHQDICYQDDGKKALPPIIKRGCEGVAQFVWIYTNTTFGNGVFLEICEVQVFGCSYQDSDGNCISCDQCKNDCNINGKCDRQGCKMDGYRPPYCKECRIGTYGNDCNSSCGHCANNATCNNVTGSCPGESCAPGWKHTNDWRCDKACNKGTFGNNCASRCSVHCAKGSFCSNIDGRCPEGCAPGWKNFYCSQRCKSGSYGQSCNSTCGHCASNVTCNHITGSCPNRKCAPGWENTEDWKCNEECKSGSYGDGCNYTCGHCDNNVTCNYVTGSCPNRKCASGWENTKDWRCDKKCKSGSYGEGCNSTCGHCADNVTCDHVTGSCPNKMCAPGWENTKDWRCNRECKKGFYGKNCSLPCGKCAENATCDHVTGSCPSGRCEPGWKDTPEQRCDQECDNGTFGYHCINKCSGHCAGGLPCNKADGICLRRCADGWRNPLCNETCGEGFYGKGCQEHCGHCGGPETCNHISGSCPGLCEPGYQGEKCVVECENGTFGLRCNFTCAEGCLSVCNKKNGTCDFCQYGYIGEFCNITVAEAQEQEVVVAAVGVGFGFMVIVLIAIIVLVVVLARKAKQRKAAGIELPERNGLSNNELLENKAQDNANKTVEDGHVEENPEVEETVIDNGEMKTLINIADLGKKIKLFSMEENKKFTAEFKGIPYGEQPHIPCSVAKQQDNMPKNRYKTTFPYDHSRVVLNVCPDNDYINGNYIKDVEGKRRYIATQGPRKNTVKDFWAMIWQENIRVIVMVTNLTEGSTIKCEQYWPGQGVQMTSGPYCLQLMSQKDYANYTQRDINITDKKTKVVRTVNQVQFTAWPDHGTPSPVELLVFYRHVMRLRQMYPDSLMVVHCSAGIGRTGTFIALDALYKQGLKEGKIDVVEYVKIMREDRMNMIQNAGQYVFLYKALYEIFKMNGRLLKKEQFIQEVTSQLMSDKAANASYFKKEFNELLAIRPVLEEQDTKDARQKIDLNMTKTVLPADNVRSFLTSYVRGRGNYYNAVSMSSYTLRDGLIAAQYPVQGAAVDLVRLLIDHECTILVSINQLTDIASSAEWFTTSAEKSVVSPYKTMLGANRSVSPNLKMTVLKLKHDKDSEWYTVKVLEILNWRVNEKLPAEEEVLVELINKVQEIVKDPETKIAVLSRDGATGCGIFCAVYNAIQQLQQDNEVDMFTIVRQLQMRRPEMISSMNEYQCCCQVVANFFDAHKDDIYANAQGQPEVTKAEENVYANT